MSGSVSSVDEVQAQVACPPPTLLGQSYSGHNEPGGVVIASVTSGGVGALGPVSPSEAIRVTLAGAVTGTLVG
jgi:hypothetical protein